MNVLEAAANANSLDIVELVLEGGADLNTPGKNPSDYQSALQAAARHNNVGMVRALLDAGANPNFHGGEHGTALQVAMDPYRNRFGKFLDEPNEHLPQTARAAE